jgi:hypothetical protein
MRKRRPRRAEAGLLLATTSNRQEEKSKPRDRGGVPMFIQLVQAQTKDKAGVKEMWDRWNREVQPAAQGYLGATGGVTDDGTLIVIARFESAEAAERNNNIPEQQQWYSEFEKYIDGEPSFTNFTNVELDQGGGSDDAGFVQLIRVKGGDRQAFKQLDDEIAEKMRELRPDVIGSVDAWEGDDSMTAIYFTSEEEARKNESNPEFQELSKRYMELTGDAKFFDLKDPWLESA